ncbi:MAG TPA: hypothetical protein DDX19_25525 [Rhodopirellula baltica]|uniref:Uncharacterized protein n=4 Tax=Rhodopirellula baltica TaxID=265606 RepID=Q7UWJ9_RHOBA|nr:hypothetical protein RBWH47_05124 [Rhodopirellula baltica WH47]EKK01178.1 hypothetical protein RBSH_03417 [Rhodopirellula baltica SH28]ELP35315.1 hypothetical protein RBSWK_00790 [Rhodopirellula baltica SWK14]CAD72364.1 hypothetical protein RB1994 [Rhodopirellula baltica SH 1]HBE66048.1 hypothetical protein [Rhodopirellula baltica]
MGGRGSWSDDFTERRSARVSKRRYHTETFDSADRRRSISFSRTFEFPLSADSASSPDRFSDAELVAFLDEQLEPSRSSEIEQAVREDEKLRQRLIQLRGQDVAGLHTIGAIWRRQRLSCPDRSTLQAYVANQLDHEMADYVLFHLTEIGCRVCRANFDDLNQQLARGRSAEEAATRRRRLFQTSAGHLRRHD